MEQMQFSSQVIFWHFFFYQTMCFYIPTEYFVFKKISIELTSEVINLNLQKSQFVKKFCFLV